MPLQTLSHRLTRRRIYLLPVLHPRHHHHQTLDRLPLLRPHRGQIRHQYLSQPHLRRIRNHHRGQNLFHHLRYQTHCCFRCFPQQSYLQAQNHRHLTSLRKLHHHCLHRRPKIPTHQIRRRGGSCRGLEDRMGTSLLVLPLRCYLLLDHLLRCYRA